MSEKKRLKQIGTALGTTFAMLFIASPLVTASDNPFEITEISSGYMLAAGSCGTSSDDDEGSEDPCDDEGSEGSCDGSGDDKGSDDSCDGSNCGESS